jgi:hypothetical protein
MLSKALSIIFGLFTSAIAVSFFLGSIAVLFGGLSFGEGAIFLKISTFTLMMVQQVVQLSSSDS